MHPELRVILIGGSSHSGKTTLARELAERSGWIHISTDSLGRHPGRPWRTKPESVPPHVVEHFLTLSDGALIESVLAHYERMWPTIEDLVVRHATDPSREKLVLEGSAVWPGRVAALNLRGISAIWLTASAELFRARMYAESGYADADDRGKTLIDRFLARTIAFDRAMMDEVRQLSLPFVEVDGTTTVEELVRQVTG